MPLQVGSPAPPFQAKAYLRPDNDFKEISLGDFEGKWVCLLFYPMDFSSVCPTEVIAFDKARPDFDERECELLMCSCDSHHTHRGWCDSNEELGQLKTPLLSDMTQRVAMDYGVLLAERGVPLRGTFLIDPKGVLRWSAIYDLPTGRSTTEVLRVLDALRTGKPVACDWKPGDATM